jgi:ABC-type dipeptide/oligopeptide/nickel transport system permease subunit
MTILDPAQLTATSLGTAVMPVSSGSGLRRTWRRYRHDRMAMTALAILAVIVVVSAFAGVLAPYDPTAVTPDVLAGPSTQHLLGNDDIGRDLLSRVLFGTRFSLLASLVAVACATTAGSAIGLVSGYLGGRVDTVLMRLTDALLAFPGLLVAMAIVGILGPGVQNAMLGLAVAFMPAFIRLVRGQVLAIREEPFIEAATVSGVSGPTIVRRHVIPNIAGPVIVQGLATMGLALLAEGALSFLGLSVQPPASSLGSLLGRGFSVVNETVRLILVPGLVITIICWTFNAIADGLRQSLEAESEG